jgi:hypothetical protein
MTNCRMLLQIFLLLAASRPTLANARCAEPDLSTRVPKFQALQSSRIDALLHFGQAHNLCFAIEYADAKMLTELVDIQASAGTIGEALTLILGRNNQLSIEARQGVIEISRRLSAPQTNDIFSYVLPVFEAQRSSLQAISNLLAMQLISDLIAPEVRGFAGSYPAGDLKDEVGPVSEHNRSLRYLLNEIIFQSKGGAWITRLPWELRTDFTVPRTRQVWTILEYGTPSSSYDFALRSIATELASAERGPP